MTAINDKLQVFLILRCFFFFLPVSIIEGNTKDQINKDKDVNFFPSKFMNFLKSIHRCFGVLRTPGKEPMVSVGS